MSAIRRHRISRSSPVASTAVTRYVSRPICTTASAWAPRFSHQAGCLALPLLEAMITHRSSSGWYSTGTVHDRPDLRPVAVNNSTGAPNIRPPIFPPLRRYSHTATPRNRRASALPNPPDRFAIVTIYQKGGPDDTGPRGVRRSSFATLICRPPGPLARPNAVVPRRRELRGEKPAQ